MFGKKTKYLAVAAALILTIIGTAAVASRTPKVAVVNMNVIIENLLEKKARTVVFKQLINNKQEDLKKIRDELQVLDKKLKLLNKDSKEYETTKKSLIEKNTIFKAKAEAANVEVNTKKFENYMTLYNKVLKEVEEFSNKKGIDLVISVVPESRQKNRPMERILSDIARRRIVYYNMEFDITAIITDQMNKKYGKK